MKASERIGKKYEMLTVMSISSTGEGHRSRTIYHCLCDCGRKSDQIDHNLLRVKSCGHYREARSTNRVWTMPEYDVWVQMNQRCYNRACLAYKNYGARGIHVAAVWRAKPGRITDWAKGVGISVPTIIRRLNEGMSIRAALTTPTKMVGRKVWAARKGNA